MVLVLALEFIVFDKWGYWDDVFSLSRLLTRYKTSRVLKLWPVTSRPSHDLWPQI